MKYCIYVICSHTHYGIFGGVPSLSDERMLVGLISETVEDQGNTAGVYQTDPGDDWCVSHWETIPDDSMWRIRGYPEILFTHVLTPNLDFVGTPFEHRYNLSLNNFISLDLEILAENERLMWEGGRSQTFIPFKNPYPQGYQGVWANLDIWPTKICNITYVHDRLSPNHVLEIDWEIA